MRSLVPLLLALLVLAGSAFADEKAEAEKHANWIRSHYSKFEYRVPMRDGTKLFTTVYRPNWSDQSFPIVFQRTPYSAWPYGASNYKPMLGPHREFDTEGFIFVFQDVRGRFMSEGKFVNMRPQTEVVNESTDAYDSIDWMIANIPHNNGRVGQWGVSYPGFYTACATINSHPALKVASPQAPIADWFWDDMHHNGAFNLQLAFNFFSIFGQKAEGPYEKWPDPFEHKTPDGYKFFLELGPLKNVNKKHFENKVDFWNKLTEHPNYDSFWQSRNLLPHLKNARCRVLTVGGWYDAEDLYGPLEIYKAIEKNSSANNTLVMGPWFHGGWLRGKGDYLGDTPFDFATSEYFQEHVMLPLFSAYLKDTEDPHLPEALIFETGANRWRRFESWPPDTSAKALFLQSDGGLAFQQASKNGSESFLSDPNNPVPSTASITIKRRREMMSEDQRYASSRPDVLTFQTEVLTDDLTLAGPLEAEIHVSTDRTAADWVVKLVDVYPGEEPKRKVGEKEFSLGEAELLVRYEILRGRFRNGFQKPEPFQPNQVTKLNLKIPDVCHTFQRGHRVMVQIQSSHFPFFDRNPQKYVKNIFEAQEGDFVKANHTIWFGPKYPSRLKVGVL